MYKILKGQWKQFFLLSPPWEVKKSLHETCCLLDWHNAISQFTINFEPKNGSLKSWVDIFVWECQKALLCTYWVHAEEHWMCVPHLGAHSPRFRVLCCLWQLEPETSFLNIPVLEMQKSGISPCTKLPDPISPKCQREDRPTDPALLQSSAPSSWHSLLQMSLRYAVKKSVSAPLQGNSHPDSAGCGK